MNKKSQKEKKQANNIRKYFQKNSSAEQKNTPPTAAKNQGKKKICTSLDEFVNSKDKSASPPLTSKKVPLQTLLKCIPFEQLLEKCPKIQQLVQTLANKVNFSQETIESIMKKYLQSNLHSLWSSKYAPSQISQLFNIKVGQKIKDWLNAFFEYKNKINEEDSFIDEASEQRSCKVYRNIRDNQWQLLALIVRGRPGIGKASTIRAVANQMDIDLQECGNDYNQTKYLKQKNQSTQSQSVKTAYSRKPKIQKNAQMITKFMAPIQKQKAKQAKKGQMIHNISIVYPQCQSQKFYNQLSRCVELSKIPFIMTNSGEKLPQVCQKYDVINYEIEDNEKIDKIIWIIYHLESLEVLNRSVQIQKQQVFEEINRQTDHFQFKQLCLMENIHGVCLLFNYRLDYIFTFIQHHRKHLGKISILPLLIDKYKHFNQDQLLEQILFIDFQKLKHSSVYWPLQEKTQDTLNTQQSCESQKIKQTQESSLQNYARQIKLLAIEDTIGSKAENIHFQKNSFDHSQWEMYPYTCINIPIHIGIKRSLVKMVNLQINSGYERNRSTIKLQELCYVSMLSKQKRANRTSRIAPDTLKKIFDQNQYCYLQHFGSLIKHD